MEKFPPTTEGYLAAKEWLIEIDEWKYISTHGFSVDGWSIINAANIRWKELHNETTVF